MKKMMVLVTTMIAMLGVVVGVGAAPASADGNVDYSTKWECATYRDIATCVSVDWSRQADGTGVRLEGMQVMTSQGCSSLESSGGRYDPVTAAWDNNDGTLNYGYDFGAEDCNFYKDVANAGSDTGYGYIFMNLHARINWAHDKIVHIGFKLAPNGDYNVQLNAVEDA